MITDYFLPSNASNAFIRVVDNNGKLIKAFDLTKTGYGQVELDCSNLALGTYHYTLLVNSQMIDTKSMIVAANH
jgi:trimeric autotransporter adhesin